MHFSEISFSNNLETLKFKNFPFWAYYIGTSHGITKQANSFLDSNFEKLATANWVLMINASTSTCGLLSLVVLYMTSSVHPLPLSTGGFYLQPNFPKGRAWQDINF